MLTGLKLSSLPCKCISYRLEHNTKGGGIKELNFEVLEMQKRNILTDRAQRVYEKNEVICLVIMFTPGVMVIKMSHMAHFLYYLLMTAKNQS